MPRGAKRNPTGRTKKDHIQVSPDAYSKAEELAKSFGIINPRTGNGNRAQLVERAIAALSLVHPKYLPKQNELMLWLLKIANSDEIPTLIKEEAETWADYLESWGIEQNLEEAIAEGAIKTKGGSWIA
jgi:hypothetical protein